MGLLREARFEQLSPGQLGEKRNCCRGEFDATVIRTRACSTEFQFLLTQTALFKWELVGWKRTPLRI